MLTSLAELPVDDTVGFYIFSVALRGWHGGLSDIIDRNFAEIARAIGRDSVIVKGLQEERFSEEVLQTYLGQNYIALLSELPALLITNAHPSNVSESTFTLMTPLKRAEEKFGSVDAFLSRLELFVRDKDQTFLNLFQREEDFSIAGTNMLELKPNFCGIGININAILDWLLKRRDPA